jgi:hypothetical protein
MFWIVNEKNGKYCEVTDQLYLFDGNWKERYLHLKKCDYLEVTAYRITSIDSVNGIPYVYDLCQDGAHFLLLVDTDRHSKEDIEKAKKDLSISQDVVSLRVKKLKKVKAPKKPASNPPLKDGIWPMAGEAVRLIRDHDVCKKGEIGIIGGVVGTRKNEISITFNYSAFSDGKVVHCSGGPATINTPAKELIETEKKMEVLFWKWKDGIPGAGRGIYYKKMVRVWEW